MIAEKDGAIGRLIFNNPARHNAVSLEMWQAVTQIMDDFEQDDAVRVIVVSGAGGRAFVSGADISEFKERRASEEAAAAYGKISEGARHAPAGHPEADDRDDPRLLHRRRRRHRARPATCASPPRARDSASRRPSSGSAMPMTASSRLIDLVGPAYAREIFYTARQFTAEEALRMGLDQPARAGRRARKLRQELLRHDRGQRAVDRALGQGRSCARR